MVDSLTDHYATSYDAFIGVIPGTGGSAATDVAADLAESMCDLDIVADVADGTPNVGLAMLDSYIAGLREAAAELHELADQMAGHRQEFIDAYGTNDGWSGPDR